ncbi:TPA: alpha-L-fucosidase [Elizabethkingia anophelis]
MKKIVHVVLSMGASFLFAQELKPYGAIPSERQLRWHELEMYALIHFTPTTFQNKDWGYGDALPEIFNPVSFDADQIAKVVASAGLKGLITVAKHHDGFCLWPTKTTAYSVASSPWRGGKGDMVKEFMQAARNAKIKFGVYLSAWDRNDMRYGTSAYADAYRAQLTELMSNYGPLFISWHDGANGGDGYYGGLKEKRVVDRTIYYQWREKTWPIVRKLQPEAVIFSDVGPDVRWVGNEGGYVAETSWATITPLGLEGKNPVPGYMNDSNLSTGDRNGKYWIPGECDVPLRKEWFYHKEEDNKVKTPDQLFDLYMTSVGRGANMDLGLAPMPSGVLHDNDVKSLKAFGKKLKETFKANLAQNATIKASDVRGQDIKKFGMQYLVDKDRYSYWATNDGITQAQLDIKLGKQSTFDIIRLRENIKLGQRIDSVKVEGLFDRQWITLGKATSIGANRLIKLNKPVTLTNLRVFIYAPVAFTLSDFGLYKEYKEAFVFDHITEIKKIKIPTEIERINQVILDEDTSKYVSIPKNESLIFNTEGKAITGIGYLPRQDGKTAGIITKYAVYTSDGNSQWMLLKEGEFSNIKANPVWARINLDKPVNSKFIKLVAKELTDGEEYTVAGVEFYVE